MTKVMIAGGESHKAEVIRKVMELADEHGVDLQVVNDNDEMEPDTRSRAHADVEGRMLLSSLYAMAAAGGLGGFMAARDPEYDPKRFSVEPTHGEEYVAARREVKKAKKAIYGPSTSKKNKKRRGF